VTSMPLIIKEMLTMCLHSLITQKEFKLQLKRSKIKISVTMVLMAQSRDFGNFIKSIVSLIFHPYDLSYHHTYPQKFLM
jgi:hypothetical protein